MAEQVMLDQRERHREYARRYRRNHPDYNGYQRTWRRNNPHYKEYQCEWQRNHREQIRENQRRYRRNHPDRVKEQRLRYYLENREKESLAYKVYYRSHLDKLRATARNYWKRHKQEKKEYDKQYNEQMKNDVIRHYSHGTMKCAKCGFSDIRALQLDHIKGNGKKDRESHRGVGVTYYVWLRTQNYPESLQVLCANCNIIKAIENHEHPNKCFGQVIPT